MNVTLLAKLRRGQVKRFLTLLLFALPLAAQTPTYTTPVLPPLQTTADVSAGVQQMTDVSTAYNTAINLLLSHDQTLFTLGQSLLAQEALIATMQAQIATMQAQIAALQSQSTPPKTPPAPIVVQAASFTNTPVGQAGFPVTCSGGTGTTTCNSAVGEVLDYSFTVATADTYTFSMSVSSSVGSTVTIAVNGGAPQTITIPSTGAFSTFETVAGPTVTLTAGMNTMVITYTSPHANINFYTWTGQ